MLAYRTIKTNIKSKNQLIKKNIVTPENETNDKLYKSKKYVKSINSKKNAKKINHKIIIEKYKQKLDNRNIRTLLIEIENKGMDK